MPTDMCGALSDKKHNRVFSEAKKREKQVLCLGFFKKIKYLCIYLQYFSSFLVLKLIRKLLI